jgi:hypothetical protein
MPPSSENKKVKKMKFVWIDLVSSFMCNVIYSCLKITILSYFSSDLYLNFILLPFYLKIKINLIVFFFYNVDEVFIKTVGTWKIKPLEVENWNKDHFEWQGRGAKYSLSHPIPIHTQTLSFLCEKNNEHSLQSYLFTNKIFKFHLY